MRVLPVSCFERVGSTSRREIRKKGCRETHFNIEKTFEVSRRYANQKI
jgi:hypothetical protein